MCIFSMVIWFLEWSSDRDWYLIMSLQINLTYGSCTCALFSIWLTSWKIDLVWLHFYFILSPSRYTFIYPMWVTFCVQNENVKPWNIEFLSRPGVHSLGYLFVDGRNSLYFSFSLSRVGFTKYLVFLVFCMIHWRTLSSIYEVVYD